MALNGVISVEWSFFDFDTFHYETVHPILQRSTFVSSRHIVSVIMDSMETKALVSLRPLRAFCE